ncbi:MAG: c-type cytochrome [Flavisolibacter sp.]
MTDHTTPITKKKNTGSNKIFIVGGLFAFIVTAGGTALGNNKSDDHFVNLKVLPKNISSKNLSKIMVDDFSDGLGVSCGFCHAETKDSHKLDYASDANPQKDMARKMMKMMLKINRQYFGLKHPMAGDSTLVVNCVSCHHGNAFPFPPQ